MVSGKEGPSLHMDRKRYNFSNEDFVRLLVRLGGSSTDEMIMVIITNALDIHQFCVQIV